MPALTPLRPGPDGCPALSFTLGNGIRVAAQERLGSTLAELRMICDGGFAADKPEQNGHAALAMAMLEACSTSLEPFGAAMRARAYADGAVLELSALAHNFAEVLALFFELVSRQKTSARELERTRAKQLAAIERARRIPVRLAERVLPRMLLAPENAYSCPFDGLGYEHTIGNLNIGNLSEYYARCFNSSAKLVVVGGVPNDGLHGLLENTFGQLKPTSPAANLTGYEHPRQITRKGNFGSVKIVLVDSPNLPQAAIFAGLGAPNRIGIDRLSIADAVAAGMFSSRLNLELRENRGWTYGAWSLLPSVRSQYWWATGCSVPSDRMIDTMRTIEAELGDLGGRRPCTAEELERAVNYLVARARSRCETCGGMADALAETLMLGNPPSHYFEFPERLHRLAPDVITDCWHMMMNGPGVRWMIIGPAAELAGALHCAGYRDIEIANHENEL